MGTAMQNNVYQAVIKPGLGKPSKYLKRKRKARDVSVSSEDDPAGIAKRRLVSHDESNSDDTAQIPPGYPSNLTSCNNLVLSDQPIHEDIDCSFTTTSTQECSPYSLGDNYCSTPNTCDSDSNIEHLEGGLLTNASGCVMMNGFNIHDESSSSSAHSSNDSNGHVDTGINTLDIESETSSLYSSDNNDEGRTDDDASVMSNNLEGYPFEKLLRFLQKDGSNDIIDKPVVVSEAEILLAALKFSNWNHLSHSSVADLYEMLNNFFGAKFFPSSRYLVDQLLNCDKSLNYHAVCPNCHKYVCQFNRQDRRVKCTLCDLVIKLKSPTYTDFFIIIDIRTELKRILEDNDESFQKIINDRMNYKDTFNDFTDGVMYKKFMQTLSENDRRNFVSFTMNSDGSPVFKSSKCSVWPVQIIVNELPFDVRTSRPLVCALWFGRNEPDMNIIFEPFVDKMEILADEGIFCKIVNKEINVKCFVLCCCVDSGARPAMQGLVQYNGYYGCPWCLHEGVYISTGPGRGCVKYPLLDEVPRKRNELEMLDHMRQSVLSRNPCCGVERPSSLINVPGLNVVDGFVPDPLHLGNEGLGEQFLDYWNSSGQPYSLTKENIDFINTCLKRLRVPNQVQRLTRPIDERSWWKAREYENWIIVYSIPILLSFPHMQEYVEHWMLFVGAYYTLMTECITKTQVQNAHTSLLEFVKDTERSYLPSAMTFNVHQLLHLAQSVINWGPLFAHTTYCFESGNGQILKTVKAAKGVVHQICRSLAMKKSELILEKHVMLNEDSRIMPFVSYLGNKMTKNTVKLSNARYFGKAKKVDDQWKNTLALSDRSAVYHRMVKDRCLFTSSKSNRVRSDNSYVVTTEGIFVRLHSFIIDFENKKEYALCKKIEVIGVHERVPHIRQITMAHGNKQAIATATIKSVCVYMDINDDEYLVTLPNLLHY